MIASFNWINKWIHEDLSLYIVNSKSRYKSYERLKYIFIFSLCDHLGPFIYVDWWTKNDFGIKPPQTNLNVTRIL